MVSRLSAFPALYSCCVDEVLADAAGARFDDPNLDRTHLGDLEEDSPYPEVRSAVANTDDMDMPCNTFRYVRLINLWRLLTWV